MTPATEAGRRLLDDLFTDTSIFNGESVTEYILAIEAEARAEHWNEGYRAGYSIGRADALREAAERVGRLTLYVEKAGTMADVAEWMRDRAVLAILDPQP